MPVGIRGAVGAERTHVEDCEQVEAMQLRREVKPRLSRVAVQMLGRRRTFVTTCRLWRDTDPALPRVAPEKS